MSYYPSFEQNVQPALGSTSDTNLAGGATFVGVADSTLHVNSIQVMFAADQNCTLYVDQSSGVKTGIGTVTTNGTTALAGLNTKFLRDLKVGDQIWVTGETVRVVANIVSDTSLTVTGAFVTTAGGLAFTQYFWDNRDSYTYYYSIDDFSRTVQAVGAYTRIRVKNDSSTLTTYFRLATVLCPIVEALPRSLSDAGYLKTKTFGIEDEYGFEVENTPIGEMRVVQPTRLVGTQFDGTTVDGNFWTATAVGSGTTTQANAQVTLQTLATPNSAATLRSVRRGRYVPGSSMAYRSIVQLSDTGVADNKRRWGIAWGATMPSVTDGAWFQLNGTTFSIVTMKGGVESKVDSGSFNGTLGATYALTTNAITYEIYWTNSKVYFVVGNTPLHTVSASADTWANTVIQHIYFDTVNSNGQTTNCQLKCRMASIRRLGALLTQPQGYSVSATTTGVVLKYSAGNVHSVIMGGTNNGGLVTLYDGTSTGGTIIYRSGTIQNNTNFSVDLKGMPFSNGLYFVLSGANENVTVIYE